MFRKIWAKNKEHFLKALDPELVVLFGSYLTSKEYKDIDLLVISQKFSNQNMLERKRNISSFFPSLNIDSWCFPTINYNDRTSIFSEIIEDGEILWQK